MKTTLIITISLNGKILVADNSNHQAPQEVFEYFIKKAQTAGNIILGTTTYKLFTEVFGFKDALSTISVVVLSDTDIVSDDFTVALSAKEAIDILQNKGYKEAIVLGGVETYRSFIHDNLVDELILSIVPLILGDGGEFVSKEDLFIKFNSMKWEAVTDNTLRLFLSQKA